MFATQEICKLVVDTDALTIQLIDPFPLAPPCEAHIIALMKAHIGSYVHFKYYCMPYAPTAWWPACWLHALLIMVASMLAICMDVCLHARSLL